MKICSFRNFDLENRRIFNDDPQDQDPIILGTKDQIQQLAKTHQTNSTNRLN